MELGLVILIWTFNAIGLFLSALTLYAYLKLDILKKPPGELFLCQIFFLFTTKLNDGIDLIIYPDYELNSLSNPTTYIYIATQTACSLYEVCISCEIFIRIKFSPMGLKYSSRKWIYHIITSIVAFSITMLYSLIPKLDSTPQYSSFSNNVFMIPYCVLNILSIIIMICCLIFMRKNTDEVKLRRLRNNMIYLLIILFFSLLFLARWVLIYKFYILYILADFLLLARYICTIVMFYVRLWEPGVRKLIKDLFKKCIKCIAMRNRGMSLGTLEINSSSSLNFYAVIDELKREVMNT
jgi:hypothetical protein